LFSEIRKQEHNTARLARRVDAQDRKIAEYWVEVHKKYSIPATVLVFVLIGAPLGMMARNGGMAVGVSYSIFFFILFWAFLIGGEHLANKMIIPPWLGMWSGPITVGLCGVYLSIHMIREASVFSFAPVVHFFKSFFRRQPGGKKGAVALVAGSVVRFVFDIPFLLTRILARRLPTYLIKQFFGWLVGMLIAMALVFVIVDYIGNLRRFENATPQMVMLYYWFYLPWILQTVLPIVVLLATMFGMGSMAKNSELTAMRGAGINVFQLAVPMFVIGMLIAGANFYVGERIIPNANLFRKNIKEDISRGTLGDYQRRQAITPVFRRDFYYFGNTNTIYGFEEFRTRPNQSRNVWRETIAQNHIVQRLEAESMSYDDSSGSWSFTNGTIRSFNGDSCRIEKFSTLTDTILRATPDEMVVRVKGVEEMSYWELRDYIDKVQRRGENASIYTAELYFKIALPMMSFIVILLGISIAAQMRKKGGAVLFGIGLFVVFAYWILSRFALAFAQNGQIPPMVGAWIGNVLFLMIGLVLFRKAIR
jgi:LPS export ABC transporter permease LptG